MSSPGEPTWFGAFNAPTAGLVIVFRVPGGYPFVWCQRNPPNISAHFISWENHRVNKNINELKLSDKYIHLYWIPTCMQYLTYISFGCDNFSNMPWICWGSISQNLPKFLLSLGQSPYTMPPLSDHSRQVFPWWVQLYDRRRLLTVESEGL